jgi:hypothetical protein
MAPKLVEKLLVALHLREKKFEKYDYDAHMDLEAQGFYNEGLVCQTPLSASLSTSSPERMKTNEQNRDKANN